jgi:hypothetical protein
MRIVNIPARNAATIKLTHYRPWIRKADSSGRREVRAQVTVGRLSF